MGTTGVLEKDINLQIARKLKDDLEEQGMEAILTRDADENLADEGASSIKVSDLKNRVAMIDQADSVLVVSIHQNSYTDSSVSGAQVFYYGQSGEGERLAQAIQENLIQTLDPSNTREAKANDSYYMLKRTSVPTVIVECGFLSNPDEEALLQEEEYQDKIVEAIRKGIRAYLENNDGDAEAA